MKVGLAYVFDKTSYFALLSRKWYLVNFEGAGVWD